MELSLIEIVKSRAIEAVEKDYPNTIRHLLNSAFKVSRGKWGTVQDKLKLDPCSSTSLRTILIFLLLEVSGNPFPTCRKNVLPELISAVSHTSEYKSLMPILKVLTREEKAKLLLDLEGPTKSHIKAVIDKIQINSRCIHLVAAFEQYLHLFSEPSLNLIATLIKNKLYHQAKKLVPFIADRVEQTKAKDILIKNYPHQEKKNLASNLKQKLAQKKSADKRNGVIQRKTEQVYLSFLNLS